MIIVEHSLLTTMKWNPRSTACVARNCRDGEFKLHVVDGSHIEGRRFDYFFFLEKEGKSRLDFKLKINSSQVINDQLM